MTFAVGALGGISLLVGAVGILTIMTIAVTERTAEIGLLRALGATHNQVLALFLGEAVVLAGDFNDWRNRVEGRFAEVGLMDAFTSGGSKPPRTFPGRLPLLRLDRIYVRGLVVQEARTLHHLHRLSDHIGLFATLTLA